MTRPADNIDAPHAAGRREARAVALERGPDIVRAVRCRRLGARIEVLAACERAIEADGGSIASLLGRDGIGAAPAVLSIPREDAVVAVAELPGDDEADLRSMARIAVVRDTAAEGVESANDFQFERRGQDGARIVAASVPVATIASLRGSTDVPIARVSVRALGTLALVRAAPEIARGLVLVVDVTRDAVEIVVVRDGLLVQSRGASVPRAAGDEANPGVDAPATGVDEAVQATRFALSSLRAAEGAATVPSRVIVLASRADFARISSDLSRVAGVAASRLESHPSVGLAAGVDPESLHASNWPLAGLLLEDEAALRRDGSAIDLLSPTGPIDTAARMRQRALIAAGLVVVAALAGWTLGAREWRGLESRRDDLEAKARNALPELRRAKRDDLRLRHIDAYAKLSPDWLAHLDALRRFAPDPSSVVLDAMTAQLSGTEIEYSREGAFVATPELRFVLDGEAKDRALADGLRDALVREKGYTLGSTGADARGGRRLPAPFAYTLRTADLAPRAQESSPSAPQGSAGDARGDSVGDTRGEAKP
ncbi:MAG: hypothetical protein LW806_03190 [Planctomycetaceae bacterium]|nr:hypothetical protein [Planctomycetaceae bacterium]